MRNYGHRFACGVVGCFFISIGCVLRNNFGFDYFAFCKKILLLKDDNDIIPAALLALVSFFFAIVLDDIVEKYDFTIEKRDMMYFSIMIGSIVIAALSFFV